MAFNREKELKRVQNKNNVYKRLGILTIAILLLIIIIYQSYAFFKLNEYHNITNTNVGTFSTSDIKLLSVYWGEEKKSIFPDADDGYLFEKIVCNNSGVGTWDNSSWSLSVTGISGPTECTVYFLEEPCVKEGNENLLKCQILSQGGGKSAIEEKSPPSFVNVATTDEGLYSSIDEYGKSYYYRGTHSLANNVIFGGFQWKIVRINGDSSIRIIYNGTEAQFNASGTVNSTGVDTQINNTSIWNQARLYDVYDAKYLGYMYGGEYGEASTSRVTDKNSGDYAVETNSVYNQTDSEAKKAVDEWYVQNIAGKEFAHQIVDNIFCNDRQFESEVGGVVSGIGKGFGKHNTFYALFHRMVTSKTPTLKCGLVNDQFTIATSSVGNKALKYPIGLLSADEAIYAGGVSFVANSSFYLFTNKAYWLFTPTTIEGGVHVSSVLANGEVYDNGLSEMQGIRPVINLDKNVVATGNGSPTNPFRVQTN